MVEEMSKAYLVLENGKVFEGEFFGSRGEVFGELVFTTGMTGYLETLTDRSYFGQIVLQTFPLIGNYGVIPADFESDTIGPSAYIVKHQCQAPSNFRCEGNLDTFLKEKGIIAICGIDTRALTRIIRENGVMNALITDKEPENADFEKIKAYEIKNPVQELELGEKELYKAENAKATVAVMDFGVNNSLIKSLNQKGLDVWAIPSSAGIKEILSVKPNAVILSEGPGDPKDNSKAVQTIRELIAEDIPIMGIGLGHQLLALARGFDTVKMHHGHRGANQPVKDMKNGRVYITSQNHGYAVEPLSIDQTKARQSFSNLNDLSCEGIEYLDILAFSAQFCPVNSGGTNDTGFLFDRLMSMMEGR